MALQPAWKPLAIVLAVLLAAVLIGAAVVIADAMNLGFKSQGRRPKPTPLKKRSCPKLR
jgi:hypothetical protein